jgi:hypothetical protein
VRELDAAQLLTVLIEKNHMVSSLQLLQDELTLLLLLLFGREAFGILQFGNGDDVEADVVLQTRGVIVDEGDDM